jgi:hypothetical protein
VPADWQPVHGDSWSFWAPPEWKVGPFVLEAGKGHATDKEADADRTENGAPVSSLHCRIYSDSGLPADLAGLRSLAKKRAEDDARGRSVKLKELTVAHPSGPQKALQIEYRSTGDGTLVLERWFVAARASSLMCSDQSGRRAPEERAILEAILASLRWTPGP